MKTIKSLIYKLSAVFFAFTIVVISTRSCENSLDIIQTSGEAKEARLDQLFAALKTCEDPHQSIILEEKIMKLLLLSDKKEVNTLMAEGVEALTEGNFSAAAAHFTSVIEKNPNYIEAWNKRATSFYMQGKIDSAMQDIEQTLILESRHFGALSGLASIYLIEGKEIQALKTYERIARIAPAEPHIQQQIQYLRGKIGIAAI